ncbi:IPT/TIG domain-containing protein [Chryseolinea sp. H1M3-3]|uniref:IPT/TIG domain-containing protein n=1 Tax=Chryseolinea sp. H1M3-3 TaxID=3034144 RepID=UPI0023EDC2B3|nr:IPT/TIG domain-containing protein [Chryseolinea sp. H1M3-3]
MKKILSTSSLLLISIGAVLIACSGSEEITPPTGTRDTIITIEERMAVFEACKKKSAELNNLEGLEDRITFLSWLATQPAFDSFGFAGEDLYAIFVDGRVVLFVNTPVDEHVGGRASVGGRSPTQYQANHSTGRTEDIPKTKKVSLFNGLGKLFHNNVGSLKSIFAEADAGYQVEVKDATIENLKAVSGDAVFYINTHGGAGQLNRKGGTQSIMALWTTQLVTDERDQLYKDDLNNRLICYMFATNDTKACEFHYAITSSFVREYMSFGENCFIYLDACNGFNESIPGNATFRDRMIAKATNEMATLVGWTGPTDNYVRTSQFFFDRLLGANAGGSISQEDPFQRPFDLAPVFADMRTEGLGVASGGVQLTYKTTLEREVLIRPIIESMKIDEYTSSLTIEGLFPWDEGKVTVNDVAAVVTSWSPNGVTCIIPETGNGSVGDVVVTSSQGIRSNVVPLTEWIIKLNYASDDNGIKLAGVCDLRLRADIHPRRSSIGETPTKPTYPDYSPSSGFIFNAKGSSAVYTLTGRKYAVCDMTGCRVQLSESPTPKVGTVNYKIPGDPNPPLFAMYNWSPEMKSIKLSYIMINVQDIPLMAEERVQCPDMDEAVIPIEMAYSAWFGFPTNEVDGAITFDIAPNYNIRPGEWSKTVDRQWGFCNEQGSFKQTLRWEVIVPKHAPTDETGARFAMDESGGG